MKEICKEQEITLEELGVQLSVAKLAAVELREAADKNQQQSQLEASTTWANDRMVTQCKGCSKEFNITRRKVCSKKMHYAFWIDIKIFCFFLF